MQQVGGVMSCTIPLTCPLFVSIIRERVKLDMELLTIGLWMSLCPLIVSMSNGCAVGHAFFKPRMFTIDVYFQYAPIAGI